MKHPYKCSTIKYDCINTGTSEKIYEVIAASKYGNIIWIEKNGYVIKTGPTEKFLENKRSTRISGPQLKIKDKKSNYGIPLDL